jgi:hypothetical protein
VEPVTGEPEPSWVRGVPGIAAVVIELATDGGDRRRLRCCCCCWRGTAAGCVVALLVGSRAPIGEAASSRDEHTT